MRTYTRRKSVHRFIENVHEFCRLCLQKTKDMGTVALFTNESEKPCPSLTMKIMICLGLEIVNDECLPNVICTECFEKLNNYYTFRKKCGIAYQTLKSHSLAIKETQVKSVATSKPQDGSNNEHSIVANYNDCKEERIILSFEEDQQLRVISSSDEITNVNSDCFANGVLQKEVLQNGVLAHDDNRIPEISEFLTTILLELGIIEKKDEQCLNSDFIGNIIELETGDACQITLQLLESNEEINNSVDPGISAQTHSKDSVSNIADKHYEQDGRPVCRECGKRFATRGVLRRHQRVHTGEKPFACRTCPRRFAQREVLRRHELVHQEQRPYPCTVCPKSFTQRGSLAAHARTHVSPAARSLSLHRCAVCPKMFLHASGLSRHLRQHNGHAMSCDTCARPFRDRSSLLRHQRSTHGARSTRDTSETSTTNDQLQT